MSKRNNFFCSSIGKKWIMGITGFMLVGFLIAHLSGNLLIFVGPEALNEYAEFLEGLGAPLWIARAGLLTAFVLHIVSAASLSRENRAARPEAYAYKNTVRASIASRSMGISGSFILFFVVGHLLHFTWGVIQPEYAHLEDASGKEDVYGMIVNGFSHAEIVIPYVLALMFVGAHLSHAISSFFQTVGFNHKTYTPLINKAGPMIAAAISLGYISIPLSVFFGIVN